MVSVDDQIQNRETKRSDAMLFTQHLMNFIILGNPATITTEEDIEFSLKVFDNDMQIAVSHLHRTYRIYACEMFKDITQQECVHMVFFDEYAASLRDRLFRRGVSYDKFLHFSVYLVCMAAKFNHHGLPQSLYSTNDAIQSVLNNCVPTYDIKALHRIAQEYIYLTNDTKAKEIEVLEMLFPESTAPVIPRSSERARFLRMFSSCVCDKAQLNKDEKKELMSSKEIKSNFVVRNPQVHLINEDLLFSPRFGRRRRRQQSLQINQDNRNSRNTPPLLDYIAVPGAYRDSNTSVIYRNPDSKEDKLMPNIRQLSRKLNKNESSKDECSEKAKFNDAILNNELRQCKIFRNKKLTPKNIKYPSSDSE